MTNGISQIEVFGAELLSVVWAFSLSKYFRNLFLRTLIIFYNSDFECVYSYTGFAKEDIGKILDGET